MASIDPKMKIFFDEAELLLNSDKTLKDIFELQFKTFPKNKVFIYEGKATTYIEYKHVCLKYANSLKEALKDIPTDSFVGLKLNNSPRWAFTFWGLIIAGYKPFLINPILGKKDVNYLLSEAGATAIITDSDEKYEVKSINLDSLSINKEIENPVWANQVAFSTSGTTGKSRIFVYTGENLCYQIYAAYCMPETSIDVMYNSDLRLIAIVPFAHIFGFVAVFFWYTFFGRTIVFPKNNSPEELVKAIKENNVSHIYAVPLFWDKVASLVKQSISQEKEKKQNLVNKMIAYNNRDIVKGEAGFASSKLVRKAVQKKALGTAVRFCISGGSALSKDTLRMINGIGYPLYNGYGMTEIGITSVELSPNVLDRNLGSVGKSLTNVEYKLENGELLVKAPQIHSFTIVNGKIEKANINKDGYFHTGDIAEIKDERVYIKGKNKDIIIGANGENIYPEEIEIRFKDLPYVNNLVVVGIKENKEEVASLILELNQRLNKDQIKELENKISEANESLPLAMQVKAFYLSSEPLPINASMKIMRYQVIDDFKNKPEIFMKLSGGEVIDFKDYDEKEVKEVVDHLIDIISEVLFIDKGKVAPNSHIVIDLGGDSFTYMSVIASIESEFNLEIKSELIGKLNTPNEFALYILRNKKN